MTIRVAVAVRDAMNNTLRAAVDGGSGAGTIKIYSGSQPANADASVAGTLLVTFTCADPAFDVSSAGVITLDADPDLSATAAATGTATWARVADSAGVTVFDGSVGTSTQDFVINTTSITSGQTITVTTGTLTFPA